uniref:hypothetical protein n=1 Tax=Falsiroseomonas oryzae TaxID=2766473 RepID=UPI0022EB177E
MSATSSSTSSSEPPAAGLGWPRFLRRAALLAALLPALFLALLVVVDPYDSGRLSPFPLAGAPTIGPRLAHASRGRDPGFDAAIIGNSHMQLISPARLDAATGLRFVSLTVQGSGVREQAALLGWFLRHRPSPPAAIVVGVDTMTCATGAAPMQSHPFPFWLYEESTLGYLGGLFRSDSAEHALLRIRARLNGGPFGRADGYEDYEQGWRGRWSAGDAIPGSGPLADGPGPFPGVAALSAALRALPDSTAVVLVVPPVFAPLLPPPGSAAARNGTACLDALRAA